MKKEDLILEPTITYEPSGLALKTCYVTLSHVKFPLMRKPDVPEKILLQHLQTFFQRSYETCIELRHEHPNNLALYHMLLFFDNNCKYVKTASYIARKSEEPEEI